MEREGIPGGGGGGELLKLIGSESLPLLLSFSSSSSLTPSSYLSSYCCQVPKGRDHGWTSQATVDGQGRLKDREVGAVPEAFPVFSVSQVLGPGDRGAH